MYAADYLDVTYMFLLCFSLAGIVTPLALLSNILESYRQGFGVVQHVVILVFASLQGVFYLGAAKDIVSEWAFNVPIAPGSHTAKEFFVAAFAALFVNLFVLASFIWTVKRLERRLWLSILGTTATLLHVVFWAIILLYVKR